MSSRTVARTSAMGSDAVRWSARQSSVKSTARPRVESSLTPTATAVSPKCCFSSVFASCVAAKLSVRADIAT